MSQTVFILGGARTPMAQFVGALKDFSAHRARARSRREARFERTGVQPDWVDHVVFGNVLQTSADAIYGARHVGLKAGVPIEVPALTVNRLCGSGIQAAVSGAQMIQLGEAGVVLAGGMESMSQVPHVIRGAAQRASSSGRASSKTRCGRRSSTRTAAARWPSPPRTAPRSTASRARSRTRYALRSQQLAAQGVDARASRSDEVVPVEIKAPQGRRARVAQDDHMRPDTTMEGLAKLPAGVQEGRRA